MARLSGMPNDSQCFIKKIGPVAEASRAASRETSLSTRMLLPVFRAVPQLVFELLLRPPIVQHAIDPARARRIRLAPEHIQVRGSHDRLGLITRHRRVVSRRIVAAVAG